MCLKGVMVSDIKNRKNSKRELGWWKRWWLVVATVFAVGVVVPAVVIWLVPILLKLWFPPSSKPYAPYTFLTTVWVQVGVAAVTTVFVGVLARNNSINQAKEARLQSKQLAATAARTELERDLRSRSSQLMSHQASAIEHLGANGNGVVQIAGVNELTWLMRGWTTLTVHTLVAIDTDKLSDTRVNDAIERWEEHIQQLVDLTFKQGQDAETNIKLIEARAISFKKLNEHLDPAMNPKMQTKVPGISLMELSTINLEGAHLEKTHLEDSHLEDSHLEKAHLEGAHLEGAHLGGAHLGGAHLENAHLENANIIAYIDDNTCLDGAFYDQWTLFPENVDPKKRGMRGV
jgi:hypothetical protein